MEKIPDINQQLKRLRQIAQRFDQEALNDGEASYLRSRVDDCVDKIRQALPEIPLLPERDYKKLQSKYQQVDEQFRSIFTVQNEKEFEAIKEAHDSFDSLRNHFVPQLSIFKTLNPFMRLMYTDETIDETISTMLTESQKLSQFLRSNRFNKICGYIHENMDQIFDQLEENPLGGKSLYIRRNESGLARSVQVFLPEGKTDIEDMMFVVQMKQHGKRRKRDILQEWLPLQVIGDDPEKLRIIGKGSYKVAKHSLIIPGAALGEKGLVDTKQVIFSTTLTPKSQSKEFLDALAVASDLTSETTALEEVMKFGLESVERDAMYHKLFQGPGVLPLIGSSRYSGTYQLQTPSLYESWSGSGENLSIGITKFSVVTIRCDGDLGYDPDQIFELEEKKSLARDIVAGLQTIHEKGYQHGDIKPDNILYKREKGILRAYLADFGFSRVWDSEKKRTGTPVFMPVDESGQPEANRHYDVYATALLLLGLLAHRNIISSSKAAIHEHKASHQQIKAFIEDTEKMKAEAEKCAMPLEDFKLMLQKKRLMWRDVDFLCGRDDLKAMFLDDEFAKTNPLAFAFVKVLYLPQIPEEDLWTEEVMNRLFGEGEKPNEGDDLTVPILRQLLTQIETIESEEEIKLDDIVARASGV